MFKTLDLVRGDDHHISRVLHHLDALPPAATQLPSKTCLQAQQFSSGLLLTLLGKAQLILFSKIGFKFRCTCSNGGWREYDSAE